MLTRRDFLRRGSLALAGGLLVGDAALEAFERLSHRKVFALGGLPDRKKWYSVMYSGSWPSTRETAVEYAWGYMGEGQPRERSAVPFLPIFA